jgi:hypothetical protein
LQAAKSVRVSGTQISGGQQLDLNVGFTETGTSGTITQGGTAIQIVVIGVVAYFKAPDSYWQKELAGNPNATAILEIVKGKWIKGPTTNARLKAFAEFTKDNFAKEVLQTSSVVSKAGTKQIDGVDAVGVNGKDSVLYVAADDARPLLIEPLAGSSDKGKIVFTEYGQVKEPTPPPAELTLDVTKLGG